MRSFTAGLIAIICCLGPLAHAGAEDDAKEAERLFGEGLKAKAAGNTKEACDLFEQALGRNRNAVGLIVNVALCYEQQGKVASAAKLFTETRDRAIEQKLDDTYRKDAQDHLDKLAVRIPHLAIAFAEPPTSDTKVVIDDQIVPTASVSDIPVDPGTRSIVVTAPGRVPYHVEIVIAEKEIKPIAVPKLGFPVTVKGRKTLGKIFTITGGAMVVAGVVLGLVAKSKYDGQFPAHCNKDTLFCDPEGHTKTQSARQLGWTGTGVGLAGGALFAVGSVFWFFTSQDTEKLAIVPTAGSDQAGLAAIGRF